MKVEGKLVEHFSVQLICISKLLILMSIDNALDKCVSQIKEIIYGLLSADFGPTLYFRIIPIRHTTWNDALSNATHSNNPEKFSK